MSSKRRRDSDAPLESFAKRKDRRRPKGRRSASALRAGSGDAKFDDPGLQNLFELGHITELHGELKSGKEATVYLVEGPGGLLAAKLYRDPEVRAFQRDDIYLRGRFVAKDVRRKAYDAAAGTGLDVDHVLWIMHEYAQLWALHDAGVPVPRPMIGPGVKQIAEAGRVVLMEFIGDDDGAAPRLADIPLEPPEAENAWRQSVDALVALLRLGKVHGDLSAYNLLWWQERVVVIDFPQMIDVKENPLALEILERDAQSLCTSFARHGLERDPLALVKRALDDAGLMVEPGPSKALIPKLG